MKTIASTPRRFVHTLGACLVALFGVIAAAHAQMVINSLPYTITTKGLYVLNNDLSSSQTSGNLITINASNVTIDFQGHYIAGPAGNTNQTTFGVVASEQSNVTIKNGTIAYCYWGIDIKGNGAANTNAVGEVVDSMRVTYCYFVGIELDTCPASRITNCQVSQTGYSGTGSAIAIDGYNSGAIIQNNTVSTVTATTGYGIFASGSFARQNTITNVTYGVTNGKYQDNLTLNCTTPFNGGTDAGGNN